MFKDDETVFHAIVDGIPDGVMIVDQHNTVQMANEAARALLDVFPGAQFPFRMINGQIALTNRTFELRVSDMPWGDEVVHLAMLREMSEGESLYRVLADHISDMVSRYSLTGEFTYVSPSCQAMLGYEPHELLGHSGMEFVHPDDIEMVMTHYATVIMERVPSLSLTFRYRHKAGHYLWVETLGHAIYSETTGEPLELITSGRDVTARVQNEEALRLAFEREKELGGLKSRFVTMASHEFRTPLTSILSSTEILIRYRERMDEAQIDEKLTLITDQVKHLTDIMSDVLNLGRLQSRQNEFKPTPVDFSELCREMIGEFQSQQKITHEIVYTHTQTPLILNLDRTLIRHALTHLLSNAVKYSPVDKPISVSLTHDHDAALLQVRDEGIGIPKTEIQRVFEPFHRAGNIGTISGTGLGLPIAKEAIERHGGTISIESEVNTGTTFTVRIPLG